MTKAWTLGGSGDAHPRRYLSLPMRKTSSVAGGSWSQRNALYAVKMTPWGRVTHEKMSDIRFKALLRLEPTGWLREAYSAFPSVGS